MSTPCEIRPGHTVGRYEFLLPIASGGMGSVWIARLVGVGGFSKLVALKVLSSHAHLPEQRTRLLLDEARFAARLRHPNVAEVLDCGEADGLCFIVMEWVEGEALNVLRRAAGGRLEPALAARIVGDAGAGLQAAHELVDDRGIPLGLVHRDVSPQNIVVGFDGVTRLVDFGLLKARGRCAEATHAGTVKGKPAYMAPEQALSIAVDQRADVFSLGVVLYELTTGHHPFRGSNAPATLANLLRGRPFLPPRRFCPDYPEALARVVMRAVALDPAARFASAAELLLALEGAVEQPARARQVAELMDRHFATLRRVRQVELAAALEAASRRVREDDPTEPRRSDGAGVSREPALGGRRARRRVGDALLTSAALIIVAVAATRLLAPGSGRAEEPPSRSLPQVAAATAPAADAGPPASSSAAAEAYSSSPPQSSTAPPAGSPRVGSVLRRAPAPPLDPLDLGF